MKLKVCGLREDENVKAVAALKPQWMGFIFAASSPRYFLSAKDPAKLLNIDDSISKVGVFVNEEESEVVQLQETYQLDYVQLHGDESVEMCRSLKERDTAVIKVFRVHDKFDFSIVESFTPYVELFLFDTAGKLYGGNGLRFNWDLLTGKRFSRQFLLSGGIGPEDAELVKSFQHPDMIGVDVNSHFETSPGVKDVAALKLFQQQIA